MNKRSLHHLLTRTRWLNPLYFVVLAVVFSGVSVLALRHNNQRMVELKHAVYAADEVNGDVQKALQNLQLYVTSHMNTDLSTGNTSVYPPIQLKYTYDRLVEAAQNKAAQSNIQLYTEAQAYCEQVNSTDFSGHNRIPCITQYVQSHGSDTSPVIANIPDSLYKFDFVSPTWSPDLAGWSIVAAVMSFLVALGLWVTRRLLYNYTS